MAVHSFNLFSFNEVELNIFSILYPITSYKGTHQKKDKNISFALKNFISMHSDSLAMHLELNLKYSQNTVSMPTI